MARPSERKRHWLRNALIAVGALVGLLVIGVAVFIATFNADDYKPRIAAALSAATGRGVRLDGPIRLAFSLHPTIELGDVALDNPPGFSRPALAHVAAIELRLDLLPLLHRQVEISRLVLVRPDILLERTAKGQDNWHLGPAQGATTATQPQQPGQTAGNRAQVDLAELRIEDGKIGYRDDRTGHVTLVTIPHLTAAAASRDAPLHIGGEAVVNGLAITVAADTGSLAALELPAPQPWPVKARVSVAGASATVAGTVARPLEGRGYAMALSGSIPDLAALAPLAPTVSLPPLHAISFAAHLADSGGPIPQVSALTLRAGAADLGSLVAGLKLDNAELTAPAIDQPVHAAVAGSFAGVPLALAGELGPPASLLSGKPAKPFPIAVTARAAGASLGVTGGIADPARLAGLDLTVIAQVPTLAALSPLAGQTLPALTAVSLQSRLTAPDGLAHGIQLAGLKLTSAQADLSGELGLVPGRPPKIRARLSSDRLNADALRAAWSAQTAGNPAASHTGGQPGARTAAPVVSPPVARPGHVIPDSKLPFDRLRDVDADITLAIAALTTGGETWHDISGHLVLQGGKLQLAPLKAHPPAGPFDLALSVDASRPAPPVTLRLQAPALAVQSLLALAGQPGIAKGAVAVQADLHGAGATLHAIASTLDGTLSASMSGGEIDNRVLERALGPVLARANPIGALQHGGSSEIRCFAARLTAHNGMATLNPFLLASTLITVDGSGTLNLGAETLDLHLHPQGRIGGTGFAVPLTVGGSFASPRVALNETGAVGEVQAVIGALTGHGGKAEPQSPSCAAVLAAARGEAAVTPPPATRGPTAPKPKLPDVGAVLRQLLR